MSALPILLSVFIVLTGCSQPRRDALLDLGFATHLLKTDQGPTRVFFRSSRFIKEIKTPRPVFLDRDYVLEFVPLIRHEQAELPILVKTYLVLDGYEVLLSETKAIPWDSDNPFCALRNRVHIDLSHYRGKKVYLKWSLAEGSATTDVSLAALKLKAKVRRRSPPPDILLICEDALRYDFAFSEQPRARMSALQLFEGQSVVYRWAFSNASWTLPAVTSALTGLFPRYHLTGRRTSDGEAKRNASTDASRGHFRVDWGGGAVLTKYSAQLVSLPEILRRYAYTTVLTTANPLYAASGLLFDGTDIAVDSPSSGKGINETIAKITDSIASDEPLFLFVHYMDVHDWEPFYLKKMFPGLKVTPNAREQLLRGYGAAVKNADRFLKALLDMWGAKRNLEDTLVVFFSDHGEQIYDPVLGHGNTMEDVLLHVPLLVKYPKGKAHPGVVRRNVSLADITPTVLDALDIPYETLTFSGQTLQAVGRKTGPDDRPLFADFQLYNEELSSVRRGALKMIVNFDRSEAELSNWRPTPAAGEGGSVDKERAAGSLRAAFEDYQKSAKEYRKGMKLEVLDRAKTLETLKSLGYVH